MVSYVVSSWDLEWEDPVAFLMKKWARELSDMNDNQVKRVMDLVGKEPRPFSDGFEPHVFDLLRHGFLREYVLDDPPRWDVASFSPAVILSLDNWGLYG
jgi:hypothetical protein